MRLSIIFSTLLLVGLVYCQDCPDFTWGDNCEYRKCGCDGKYGDTCPDGTMFGLPCCEFCPLTNWNCKCGDGCEGTDNCCMYCPSRYLPADQPMTPFWLKQEPGLVFVADEKTYSIEDARSACRALRGDLLMVKSAYAASELEAYINTFLDVQGQKEFWLDGFTSKQGFLYWQDWDQVKRLVETPNCMIVSNKLENRTNLKNWETAGATCVPEYGRPALCYDTDKFYGRFHEKLNATKYPGQETHSAYFPGYVDCVEVQNRDPYVTAYSEEEVDLLAHEMEWLDVQETGFFLKGYTNATSGQRLHIPQDVNANMPMNYYEPGGINCVYFSGRSNGNHWQWKVTAATCYNRYYNPARMTVCWFDEPGIDLDFAFF